MNSDQFVEVYIRWVRGKGGMLYKDCRENGLLLTSRLEEKFNRGEEVTVDDWEATFQKAQAEGVLIPVEISLKDAEARIQKEKDAINKRNRELEARDRADALTDTEGRLPHRSEAEIEMDKATFKAEAAKRYVEQVCKIWVDHLNAATSEDAYNEVVNKIREQCADGPYTVFAEDWISKNAKGYAARQSASALDAVTSLTSILAEMKVSTATREDQNAVKRFLRDTPNAVLALVRKNAPAEMLKVQQIVAKQFSAEVD